MSTASTRFDLEHFISACESALREERPERALREITASALSNSSAILRALGEPRRGEIQRLHHTPHLTILNVVWAPHMRLMPHDHRMWAVIGLYTGREDNVFWRRVAEDEDGRIEPAGARTLASGEAISLGRDIVHSVTNPIGRFSAALHLYGGDFFAQHRSEWDPETLTERPFDVERTQQLFRDANESASPSITDAARGPKAPRK